MDQLKGNVKHCITRSLKQNLILSKWARYLLRTRDEEGSVKKLFEIFVEKRQIWNPRCR